MGNKKKIAVGRLGLLIVLMFGGILGCGDSDGGGGQPAGAKTEDHKGSPSSICSLSSVGRIYGGENMREEDSLAKSIVGIVRFSEDGYLCTGVIISNDTILTAAHCVIGKPSEFKIAFYNSLIRPDCPRAESVREVETLLAHEDYKTKQNMFKSNDIALIKIKGTIPLGFKPMKLMMDYSRVSNEDVIVAGFGVSATKEKDYGTLKRTQLRRLTEIEKRDGSYLSLGWDLPALVFDQSRGTGICQGDSGGGAFVKVGDEYRLIGIASVVISPEGQEPCSQLAAHMNTRFYSEWIREKMKQLHPQKEK